MRINASGGGCPIGSSAQFRARQRPPPPPPPPAVAAPGIPPRRKSPSVAASRRSPACRSPRPALGERLSASFDLSLGPTRLLRERLVRSRRCAPGCQRACILRACRWCRNLAWLRENLDDHAGRCRPHSVGVPSSAVDADVGTADLSGFCLHASVACERPDRKSVV